jgi:hypothetical protein
MTKQILKFVGYKPREIQAKASAFKKHDEASLYKSFDFFEEESHLINFARKTKDELERILQTSSADIKTDVES